MQPVTYFHYGDTDPLVTYKVKFRVDGVEKVGKVQGRYSDGTLVVRIRKHKEKIIEEYVLRPWEILDRTSSRCEL